MAEKLELNLGNERISNYHVTYKGYAAGRRAGWPKEKLTQFTNDVTKFIDLRTKGDIDVREGRERFRDDPQLALIKVMKEYFTITGSFYTKDEFNK